MTREDLNSFLDTKDLPAHVREAIDGVPFDVLFYPFMNKATVLDVICSFGLDVVRRRGMIDPMIPFMQEQIAKVLAEDTAIKRMMHE